MGSSRGYLFKAFALLATSKSSINILSLKFKHCCILTTVALGNAQTNVGFTVNTHDLTVLVNENETFVITG